MVPRSLGVGMVYWPALKPLFDAGPSTVAVLELEPQTLWEKVRSDGRWQYRLNEAQLDSVAAYPQATLLHGIGQPVGGSTDDHVEYLGLLRRAVDRLDPCWVSEHLSFNRINGSAGQDEAGFLLPPHQSAPTVRVAARNVRAYGRGLGRPVAFETGVNYLRPHPGELTDGEFFAAVAERADSGILLDLHNLWCNEVNGREKMVDVLDRLPLDRVWELHLAGGMPMSGYWLDAHSDAVPDEVMAVAGELMPRLTNLGAVLFEILPEHVPTLGIDGVHRQLQELHALWAQRGHRTLAVQSFSKMSAADQRSGFDDDADPEDLVAMRAWEWAMVTAIRGDEGLDGPHQWISRDPGIAVFRDLVGDFRRSALARGLRYTMTALLVGLGARRTSELLDGYFAAQPPDGFAAVEAHHFACYLADRPALQLDIPYLGDVLGFEHALVRATIFGTSSDVHFSADPLEILGALDLGRLPARLPAASSTMHIAAGGL